MAAAELKITVRMSRTGQFLAVFYAVLFWGCRRVGVRPARFSAGMIDWLVQRHTQVRIDGRWRPLQRWRRR
jgi:hypothetical protein